MKKICYNFDNGLFTCLLKEFRTEFSISTSFSDYEKIRQIINDETKEEEADRIGYKNRFRKGVKDADKLSEDTIKRAFGIISSKKNSNPESMVFSQTTCNIIARKLKYRGWDDFCEKSNQKYDIIKGFKTIDMYGFSSLIVNQDVCIGWHPHKYCMLMYLGDYTFKVIESYGMKSEINRVFETIGFELAESVSKYAYPDVIIRPFLDDDPDLKNIEIGIIPLKYLL